MTKPWVCVLLMAAVTAACNITEGKGQGEALAERYFAAVGKNDEASVFAVYDEAFYQATPAPKWRDMYGRIRTKLGKSRTHELTNWTVNAVASTVGTGQYVTLVYRVDYDAGPGTETIGVFIPAGSGRPGIRTHNFNADAFAH